MIGQRTSAEANGPMIAGGSIAIIENGSVDAVVVVVVPPWKRHIKACLPP